MKTTKFFKGTKVLLGKVNGENIYLSAPSWDCGWYWGFGYLGNNNCHYHVNGLKKKETYNFEKKCFEYQFFNLYDGFKNHFDEGTFIVKDSDLWEFCELFETFYKLKETAEIYVRGGCNYTTNPISAIIKNESEAVRINSEILPLVFDAIFDILERNKNNGLTYKKIVSLFLDGNTQNVVDYMNKNGIHTDDLKNIHELTSNDFNVIHTYYWREFHKNKKATK